jgi:hypothetical protein
VGFRKESGPSAYFNSATWTIGRIFFPVDWAAELLVGIWFSISLQQYVPLPTTYNTDKTVWSTI